MKEANKLKLMKIATILQQVSSSGNINGRGGLALVNATILNELGDRIEDIIEDELKSKKKS